MRIYTPLKYTGKALLSNKKVFIQRNPITPTMASLGALKRGMATTLFLVWIFLFILIGAIALFALPALPPEVVASQIDMLPA